MAKGGDTRPVGDFMVEDFDVVANDIEVGSFVSESNRIEGITRPFTEAEFAEHVRFVRLDAPTVEDLERFVSVYQPGKKLRTQAGMDVRVGNHIAPRGGPEIRPKLESILNAAMASRLHSSMNLRAEIAYHTHVAYETLHPFMDGNGRSGRALWAWCMGGVHPLGFLHHWYYQTLAYSKQRRPDKED